MEENNLRWCVRNSVESLIKSVKTTEKIEYNDAMNMKEFK